MNRLLVPFLLASVFWQGDCQLRAQDQDSNNAPPQPPFVVTSSPSAAWAIACSPDTAGPAAAGTSPTPAAGLPKGPATLKEIRITKAGDDRQVLRTLSNGHTVEMWFHRDRIIMKSTGDTIPAVVDPSRLIGVSFPDFSKTDFPELSWIKAEDYGGVKSYQGHTCYWFHTEGGSPIANNGQIPLATRLLVQTTGAQQAWVDKDTHVPVAFDDGTTLEIYSFNVSSSNPTMPPAFAAAYDRAHASEAP